MSLKFKIDADEYEGLEEAQQTLYAKSGKFYQLKVEGAVDKDKLAQFRKSNINLQKTVDELNDKFGDLDLEKVNALLEKEHELEEGKLIKEGDIDTLLEKRLAKAMKPLKEQNEALTTKYGAAKESLVKLTIDNSVTKKAAKLGAHETALDDLCTRARKVFRVDEKGHAVALDSDGDPLTDGEGKVLDIDGWLGVQKVKEAPHCFRQSSGGNENGSGQKKVQQSGDKTSHDKIRDGLKARGMAH